MEFKPFEEQHLTELEAMILALYREDSGGEPMSPGKIGRTARELARHPEKGRILLFVAGETVVGYAIVIRYWSNEYGGDILFVDELYVKPDWRRRGIASRFFEYLSTCEPTTVKALALEVRPSNERAFRYYQKLGFVPSPSRELIKLL
jgi:ribosomal protein S18 acetylase RimI-like enzyme